MQLSIFAALGVVWAAAVSALVSMCFVLSSSDYRDVAHGQTDTVGRFVTASYVRCLAPGPISRPIDSCTPRILAEAQTQGGPAFGALVKQRLAILSARQAQHA